MSEQTVSKLTAYECSKVVNSKLKELDIKVADKVKQLPPQMFYTYVGKGYIPSDEHNLVTVTDLAQWFKDYLPKLVRRIENANKVLPTL